MFVMRVMRVMGMMFGLRVNVKLVTKSFIIKDSGIPCCWYDFKDELPRNRMSQKVVEDHQRYKKADNALGTEPDRYLKAVCQDGPTNPEQPTHKFPHLGIS